MMNDSSLGKVDERKSKLFLVKRKSGQKCFNVSNDARWCEQLTVGELLN